MSGDEIRMRLIEALLPSASKAGLTNPQDIVKTATTLEQYIVGTPAASQAAGQTPNQGPRHKGKRRNKQQADDKVFN